MQPASFFQEVSHEIKLEKLPKDNNNLNKFLLKRYEDAGIEIIKYAMRNGLIGAAIQNPLEKLLKKGIITHKEFFAACKYSVDLEHANKSNRARPIYDGTPISSASNSFKEKSLSQDRLDAASRVFLIRQAIEKEDEPKQFKDFKKTDFKTRHRRTTTNRKLIKILELLFERQFTINVVEKETGINHRMIEERAKEICAIMLSTNDK